MRDGPTRKEIREELRFYLDERARELVEQGMGADEAARAAEGAFGDVSRIEDEILREAEAAVMKRDRTWAIERWLLDVAMAFRSLRRNPAFAVWVIILLATGIAASTTVFSVVDAVVRPRVGWIGGGIPARHLLRRERCRRRKADVLRTPLGVRDCVRDQLVEVVDGLAHLREAEVADEARHCDGEYAAAHRDDRGEL